ncbi:radical SAM/SPASM domain-containing protein [Clostridium hydrogenum]|uniref:radical SAM/SPASM domain-containing protein n=1 Tax=Clostridium hydrogenum TaxID=2855764 RepID=UPI001F28BD69|nr:radical SAM protein [Clostridium hydrogenum]
MNKMYDNVYVIDRDENTKILYNAETSSIALYSSKPDEINLKIKEVFKNDKIKDMVTPNNVIDRTWLKHLIICSSETCNLACKYCFANAGTYDRKGNKVMVFDDYKKIFEFILNNYPDGVKVINFFGGEPLIGFSEIEKFICYAEDVCRQKNITQPLFSVITNGTLLTNEIVEFIIEHSVLVTISMDANKECHDSMRVFKDGRGSYDTVLNNLKLLRDRGYTFEVESTVGEAFLRTYNAGSINEYFNNFYELGAQNVSTYIADYNNVNELPTEFERNIRTFYYDMVDYCFEMLQDEEKCMTVPITILNIIINIVTKRKAKYCTAGKESLFYTIDGVFYPCQMYYEAKKDKISSIFDNESNIKDKMNEFKKVDRSEIEKCKKCFCNRVCTLWCEGSSLLFNGNKKSVIESRCAVQRVITERVILNLVKLVTNKEEYKNFSKNVKKLSINFSEANFNSYEYYKKSLERVDN